MTVLLTLTTAGIDTGPFDLYTNADSFTTPFETGVSKAALQSGYLSSLVPDATTIVRVVSTGQCVNYLDIILVLNSYLFNLKQGVDCPTACTLPIAKIFM